MEISIIVILAVQTVFFAVAAFAVYRASIKISSAADRLDEITQTIRPKITEIVDGVNKFVKTCQPLGEQLVDISISLREVMEITKDTTDEVADFIQDTTHTARRQISKIDNLLTDTVKKTELLTNTIMNTLLNPLAEISALLQGVRSAIAYLKGKRPDRLSRQFNEDEDMMI